MTTIIERPSGEGDSGGTVLMAVIVGALVAGVIAMVAYNGGFDRSPTGTDTNLTITVPSAPSPEAAPKEAQPAPQPTPEPSPAPVQ
jgi:hypothetical protein